MNENQAGTKPREILWDHSTERLFLLEEKLESGEIDLGLWILYFPDFPVDRAPYCEDCAVFHCCRYHHDTDPIECFSRPERHLKSSEKAKVRVKALVRGLRA